MFKNKELYLMFFFFFLILFVTMAPNIGGDAGLSYQVAKNLLSKGDILLDNNKYCGYGLFLSVWLVPFYLLGSFLAKIFSNGILINIFVGLANTFIISFLGVYFYYFLRHFNLKKITRFYSACFFIFSSMLWNYNSVTFTEQITCLLAMIIFDYLFVYKQTGEIKNVLWAGLALGLSIHVKFSAYILLFVPFFLYLILIMREKKKIDLRVLILFFMPYLVSVLLNLYLNYYKFCEWKMSYSVEPDFFWTADGVFGQLFSSGKGLLFYNLPLIIALFYFRKLWIEFKKEFICTVVMFVAFLFINSCVSYWHAGAGWGPRYIMPVLPFLFIPFAFFMESILGLGNRLLKIIVICFFVFCSVVQFNGFVFSFTKWATILDKEEINEYYMYFLPRYSPLFGTNYLAYSYINKLRTNSYPVLNLKCYYDKKIDLNKYSELIKPGLWIYKIISGDFVEKNSDKIVFSKNIKLKIFGIFIFCFCLFFAGFIFNKLRRELRESPIASNISNRLV